MAGWTSLIDLLMQKAPRVGACLMNGLPSLDQGSGKLTIAFAADKSFQVRSICGDSALIETAACRLWGRPVKVELVLGDKGQTAATAEQIRQEVAPTHREELQRACAADKTLGDLVDLLGGQPLPDSDRPKWDPAAP